MSISRSLSLCIYIYMYVCKVVRVWCFFHGSVLRHVATVAGSRFSVSTRPARRGAHLSTSLSALVCTPSSNVDVTLFSE